MERNGYDLFISHAGPDLQLAEQVFDMFSDEFAPFLASKSIPLAASWPQRLQWAIQNSKVVLVLITEHTANAHYQNEEILRSIALSRQPNQEHRVVPLTIGAVEQIPFGLQHLQGISLLTAVELASVFDMLAPVLRKVALAVESTGEGDFFWMKCFADGKKILETTCPYVGVGRDERHLLVLSDDSVSRDHADLTLVGPYLLLRHLSRTSPTVIDRPDQSRIRLDGHRRLDEVEVPVNSVIKLGSARPVQIQYEIGGKGVRYSTTVG